MYWYPGLYVGETAKKKKEDLIQKIESGKTPVNTYLVLIPESQENQLEIIAAWNLKYWRRERTRQRVVGLACGQAEAKRLVCEITQDVYERTGDTRIRDYFAERFGSRAD